MAVDDISKNIRSAARFSDADLILILVISVTGLAFAIVPQLSSSIIRPVIEIAILLFVPGYCALAVIFPRKADLPGFERLALSFGLSVAVVPLLAYGLAVTSWGLSVQSVATGIFLFIVAGTALAYARRYALPLEERFSVRFMTVIPAMRTLRPRTNSQLHSVLAILLVFSILFSVSALAYAILTPEPHENFTELYLFGPEGEMRGYPTNFSLGQQKPVIVAVANHENRDVNYTLVVNLNDTRTSSTLYSQNITVANGQTWQRTILLKPDRTGNSERIDFLLYRDGNMVTPYRQTFLLANVTRNP
jgi:uncharacterized membrane protein